jgi:hypothetical protein
MSDVIMVARISGVNTVVCVQVTESTTSSTSQPIKLKAAYCLEHLLMISMAQAIIYLSDPHLARNDKQVFKRELAAELVRCSMCYVVNAVEQ